LDLYYSDVMLYGCSIYDNFARGDGGGIYIYGSTLYATNTPVFDNRAHSGTFIIGENGCGGGIYANKSTIDLREDSLVYSNTAFNTGGGIRIYDSEAILLTSHVYNNHADIGGGVAAYSSIYNQLYQVALYANLANTKGGGLLLENNSTGTIAGAGAYIGFAPPLGGPNVVTNGDGGGIYVSGSILTMSNMAAVTHNSASIYGGGIYSTNGTLKVYNAFVGVPSPGFTNTAYQGGGIYAMDSNLNITNSIIAHGLAVVDVGGILLKSSSTIMENSHVINNWSTRYGGGILFTLSLL